MTRYRLRILAGRLSQGVGSHNYNRELARHLAQRGHDVSVVCFERSESLPSSVRQVEIRPKGYDCYPLVWRYASWLEWRHCSREHVREKFSWDAHVGRYETLFEQLRTTVVPRG